MARGRYEDNHKLYLWLITLDITKFKIDSPSCIAVMSPMSGSSCIYLSPTTVFVLQKMFFNPRKFLVVEMAVTLLSPSYRRSSG